jgi:hypothetical protein
MQGIQRKSNLCVHRSLAKGGLRGVVQGVQAKTFCGRILRSEHYCETNPSSALSVTVVTETRLFLLLA